MACSVNSSKSGTNSHLDQHLFWTPDAGKIVCNQYWHWTKACLFLCVLGKSILQSLDHIYQPFFVYAHKPFIWTLKAIEMRKYWNGIEACSLNINIYYFNIVYIWGKAVSHTINLMLYIFQVFYTTCFGIISLPSSGVSTEEISSHRTKGLLIVYSLNVWDSYLAKLSN
jgi:hypothetical protein